MTKRTVHRDCIVCGDLRYRCVYCLIENVRSLHQFSDQNDAIYCNNCHDEAWEVETPAVYIEGGSADYQGHRALLKAMKEHAGTCTIDRAAAGLTQTVTLYKANTGEPVKIQVSPGGRC